jgi:hypothetical protein
MKNVKFVLVIFTLMFVSTSSFGQKGKVVLNTNEVPEETHVHLDNFPKDQALPMIHGWGGFTVDINNAPAGSDFRPLLVGLENDHCQVPHWGYVVKGAILIEYEDGTSDVFREGEAFYMRAGHTGEVLEDLLLVSFSPEEGMHDLADHLEKRIAELQKQQTASEK